MIADEYERPEWANDAIGVRWWEFNLANPVVLSRLISLCMDWREARPGERVSMKMLWERLRWETAVGDATADYRLNNSYTSLYARFILVLRPEWDGMFETRERRCDVVADKPDPVAFTAYSGCPNGTCPTPTDCRTVGECYALGEPNGECQHRHVTVFTLAGAQVRTYCAYCEQTLEEAPDGGSD